MNSVIDSLLLNSPQIFGMFGTCATHTCVPLRLSDLNCFFFYILLKCVIIILFWSTSMLHGVCRGGRGTWQSARDVDVVVVAEVA